jgi:hypothetical protein
MTECLIFILDDIFPGAGRPLTGLRAFSKWAARQMHTSILIGRKTLSGVSGYKPFWFWLEQVRLLTDKVN